MPPYDPKDDQGAPKGDSEAKLPWSVTLFMMLFGIVVKFNLSMDFAEFCMCFLTKIMCYIFYFAQRGGE